MVPVLTLPPAEALNATGPAKFVTTRFNSSRAVIVTLKGWSMNCGETTALKSK